VHLLRGAENRVDRAGLDALGAADADVLVDDGNRRHRLGDTVVRVQRNRLAAEQLGELEDAVLAAGRALVDLGLAFGDRGGIRPAAGKAALAALRLRQDLVDLLDQRIALDPEAHGSKAEADAEHGGQRRQRDDRG
jgi:hypothetical protein